MSRVIPLTPAQPRQPKPDWLKVRAPGSPSYTRLKGIMRDLGLHTVCEEAQCPNIGECWHHGTATFMILGDVCTRACSYCAVARGRLPECRIEVLIPDFQGSESALRTVLDARPDVLNHNTETVPRLYKMARSGGRYSRTLELLDRARRYAPDIPTKSGVMVGLGEERDE